MNKTDSLERLANEYVSKCNWCDECFAETYCTLNGLRESREPCKNEEKCVNTIINYLRSL